MALNRVACDHCREQIAFLPTVWGSERPLRPYDVAGEGLKKIPLAEAGEYARFVYSRRRGGVVQLEPQLPADAPRMPAAVLSPHRCGRLAKVEFDAYTSALTGAVNRLAPGLGEPIVGWVKDGPAADRPRPPDSRGYGMRRGLGRRDRPGSGGEPAP